MEYTTAHPNPPPTQPTTTPTPTPTPAPSIAWRAKFSIHRVMTGHGGHDADRHYHSDDSRRKSPLAEWSFARTPTSPEAHLAERHGFYGKLTATHADGGPIGVWRLGMADYSGYSRAGPQMVEAVKEGFIVHLEDILQRWAIG